MKLPVLLVSTTALSMRVCAADDHPPPPPPPTMAVQAEVEVEVPEPQHGGQVVVVGERPVEVVVRRDGVVNAYVIHEGPPPADVDVRVHVHGVDGAVHPVELTWHAEAEVYVGRLVEVRPAPGPVGVQLVVGTHVHRAHLATLEVAPPRVRVVAPPPPRVRGGVDVRVDVPRPPSLDVRVGFGVDVDHEHRREVRVRQRRHHRDHWVPPGHRRGHPSMMGRGR